MHKLSVPVSACCFSLLFWPAPMIRTGRKHGRQWQRGGDDPIHGFAKGVKCSELPTVTAPPEGTFDELVERGFTSTLVRKSEGCLE
jgi:hypothetical protein